MINPTSWQDAEIHFAQLHDLGGQIGQKIQHGAKVQLEGAWVHIQMPQDEQHITVPAAVVKRIEWRP